MKAGQRIGALMFQLFAGPAIWFAHLNILYGAHTVMCAHATPANFLTLSVFVSVVALVAVVIVARQLSRANSTQAMHRMSLGLAALSFLGICWTAIASSLATRSC